MQHVIGSAERSVLRRRIGFLGLAVLGWSACVGLRLIDLQLRRAPEMRGLARRQHEQVITLDARRGMLYDRTGRELAMSIEVDSVYAVPAEIDDPARTAAALAPVLGPDPATTRSLVTKMTGDKLFVWLKRKIEPETRAALEALSLDGIGFAREHKRFYPHGSLASHVLGWVGMDNTGMDGLELTLDERIRGTNGQVFTLRDARGRKFLKITRRAPRPGNSVVLSIDETIQHIAERELAAAIEKTGAAAGTVIVMQPATGDVLAMASHPTFNPNLPGEAPADHRRNRAVVDAYEPGSTFKVVTMAAALERGLVRASEMLDCQRGSIRVGRSLIRDHKPFGILSASEVLQESSNVGAIKIGLRLRGEDFHDTMRSLGFGSRTGIELPGEARGLVREPREWSGVSQATLSFGQEIGVTPLQLVTAISAVANGGRLQQPRILLRELDAAGATVRAAGSRPGAAVLQESTARTLRQMMISVVDEGTAKAARMPGYGVAGKTGTAQKIGPEGTYSANRFVASFVGFTPVSRPALTILVVLDEPRGAMYHGGDIAAPVFRRIALPALRYLGVPPEEGRLRHEDDEPTLAAAVHAKRWIHPVPLDEKERLAERLRIEKERLAALRRASRSRPKDDERDTGPVAPEKVPLPAPAAVTAGDDVILADLRGHSLRRAVSYLSQIGLTARLDVDEEVAPGGDGVVIGHEPGPGVLVRRGVEVALRPGRFLETPPDDAAATAEAEGAKEESGPAVPPARGRRAAGRRSMR